jgi:putative ABC transport system permease protein
VKAIGWSLAWSLARRDLHRSLQGLRLLFLCIFLGVATLAAIGSLTAAITGELATRGQVILGGDVQVGMSQRQASAAERAAMERAGQVSETIRLRSMARSPDGAAVLAELKGVDSLYPLYGALEVGGRSVRAPAPDEIYIAPELGERLSLQAGGRLRFGEAEFRIAGIIAEEPDRVGEGFTLGPVALVSMDGLRRTGLVQPGSLYDTRYRLRLPASADPEAVAEDLKERFPASSWELRDRDRAAPGANRFFDRMGQFLTLVGLAALVIAGIGVSNGVASYLRQKQDGIATLKMLGATAGDIGRVYLVQIGLVTLLAVGAGLLVGAMLPPLAIAIAGDLLPVQPGLRLHPLPLAVSAAYGLLMALIFVLPPLGRARLLPVATLFREMVAERRRPDRRTIVLVLAAAALVVALAVGTSDNRLFAASVLGAVVGVIVLLMALGWAVRRVARGLPRPRRPLLRLAVTGLHRPGAQTVGLVVALGLALSLFVTLAAVQTSLSAEIARAVPDRAPDQFVLDVPAVERGRFEAIVREAAPRSELNVVPNLRGTITAYGETRVADLEELPEGAWFLRGERGVTYSPTVPQGSDVVEGAWWPADYRGPPLVSLDREAAEILGLGIGDTITVSVLGREIEARIASLREIHWDTMGFNYIMVFPPSTLASAPHNLAATISGDTARQPALTRALLAAFPSVSIVDVGELISEVGTILDQMAAAILVAASVAVLAGIAVLIGAIAASRQARSYDSVIMKMLGATRRQILAAQALEYGLLALVVAAASLGFGVAGAWFVIVQVFEFGWRPDWAVILGTLLAGSVLTLGIALLGSLPLLRLRPAAALRTA